ncbi:hypothetical protein GQ600_10770 [Phytophthora cactorum]|nr:hypothetical protein GQ600_10770 [Phytophthora cactorum]
MTATGTGTKLVFLRLSTGIGTGATNAARWAPLASRSSSLPSTLPALASRANCLRPLRVGRRHRRLRDDRSGRAGSRAMGASSLRTHAYDAACRRAGSPRVPVGGNTRRHNSRAWHWAKSVDARAWWFELEAPCRTRLGRGTKKAGGCGLEKLAIVGVFGDSVVDRPTPSHLAAIAAEALALLHLGVQAQDTRVRLLCPAVDRPIE